MFKSTRNKGFSMTFNNGWTISVQFGPGNYCSNQSRYSSEEDEYEAPMNAKDGIWISEETAEIAAWDKDGNWYSFGQDTVIGWINADEVAEWIIKVKEWQ